MRQDFSSRQAELDFVNKYSVAKNVVTIDIGQKLIFRKGLSIHLRERREEEGWRERESQADFTWSPEPDPKTQRS